MAQWFCAHGFLKLQKGPEALAALKRFVELASDDPRAAEANKVIKNMEGK